MRAVRSRILTAWPPAVARSSARRRLDSHRLRRLRGSASAARSVEPSRQASCGWQRNRRRASRQRLRVTKRIHDWRRQAGALLHERAGGPIGGASASPVGSRSPAATTRLGDSRQAARCKLPSRRRVADGRQAQRLAGRRAESAPAARQSAGAGAVCGASRRLTAVADHRTLVHAAGRRALNLRDAVRG